MKCRHLTFSGHAIRRMFERRISPRELRTVIEDGVVVADYPHDRPWPSRLLLGDPGGGPLHVVVAFDADADDCRVVTVYRPDPSLWEADFKTRRP
jgi:hypothetical protein